MSQELTSGASGAGPPPRWDPLKVLSAACGAFFLILGALPVLNSGLQGRGLVLVGAASFSALGTGLAVHELLEYRRLSTAEDFRPTACKALLMRATAGGLMPVLVVVGAAALQLTQVTDNEGGDDASATSPPATHDTSTSPNASSERRVEEEIEEITDSDCDVPANASQGPIASRLDVSKLQAGVQFASLQQAALPLLPQWTHGNEEGVQLAYGGDGWIVFVLLDCDAVVLAFTFTSTNFEVFSPTLSGCSTEDGLLSSVRLPMLGDRTSAVYLQTSGANTPPGYAEFAQTRRVDGCLQARTIMYGSVVAAEMGVSGYGRNDSFVGYLPIDADISEVYDDHSTLEAYPGWGSELPASHDGLVRPDPYNPPNHVCAQATSYGESVLEAEEWIRFRPLPTYWQTSRLSGYWIPESFGSDGC